jgi:hypothetical protein
MSVILTAILWALHLSCLLFSFVASAKIDDRAALDRVQATPHQIARGTLVFLGLSAAFLFAAKVTS